MGATDIKYVFYYLGNRMCFTWTCGGRNLFHLQYKIRRFNVFPAFSRYDPIKRFHGELCTDEYIYKFKQLSLNLMCLYCLFTGTSAKQLI